MTRRIRRVHPATILAVVEEELEMLARGDGYAGRLPAILLPTPASVDDAALRASLADAHEQMVVLEKQNADHTAVRESLQAEIHAKVAQFESERAENSAARQGLEKELEQRTGEVTALRARLREEISERADAVQRVESLEQELTALAAEVLAADVSRQRRGFFRRAPKAPAARPSAARPPRPADQAPPAGAVAAVPADEELESVLDRRLFGI